MLLSIHSNNQYEVGVQNYEMINKKVCADLTQPSVNILLSVSILAVLVAWAYHLRLNHNKYKPV